LAADHDERLAQALRRVRLYEQELDALRRELDATNRGVIALDAELEQRAEFLQRVSQSREKFLRSAGHEFRSPLNSIMSLAQMLLDRADGDLSPDQEKQVRFILDSAKGLFELVSGLLDLAKVDAGRVTVNVAGFTAQDLFSALRGVFRPLHTNPAVDLIFDDPSDIPLLETDQTKLFQILRNLISNGLKFTGRGSVRVSARSMADADQVAFCVVDTGIGIPPGEQQRVFEEFVQLESPVSHARKGSGLGLPLSKRLTELLGGRLKLESVPGSGSRFCATLPRVYTGPTERQF
jgi:signal transduction histidine kinase